MQYTALLLLPLALYLFAYRTVPSLLSFGFVALAATYFSLLGNGLQKFLGWRKCGVCVSILLGQFTVLFLFLFFSIVFSLIYLEPGSSSFRLLCVLSMVPLLYFFRGEWKDLLSPTELIAICLLLIVPWSAYSIYFGAIGHDAAQHIFWSLQIYDEGLKSLVARGSDILEPYPKLYHSLVYIWGMFSSRPYLGPMVKFMPDLQMLLGLGAIAETFFTERKLGWRLYIFLSFVLTQIFYLELSPVQDWTARNSSLGALGLYAWLLHFSRESSGQKLLGVLFVCGFLVGLNPAFLPLTIVLLILFLWLSKPIKIQISHFFWIPALVLVFTWDAYYWVAIGNSIPDFKELVKSLLSFRFPSDVGDFASAARATPQFNDPWVWNNIWTTFNLKVIPIFAEFEIAYMLPWQKYSLAFLVLGISIWGYFGRKFSSTFFLKAITIFFVFCGLYLLCSVFLGSFLDLNLQRIFLWYSLYSIPRLLVLILSVCLIFLLVERVLGEKVYLLFNSPYIGGWGFLWIALFSYSSYWTFKAPRSNSKIGKVTLADIEALHRLEEKLDHPVYLPCAFAQEFKQENNFEKWLISKPGARLVAFSKHGQYLCNFYLGASIRYSSDTHAAACKNPDLLRNYGVRYSLVWAPRRKQKENLSLLSSKTVANCAPGQSLYDMGFEQYPSFVDGQIAIFSLRGISDSP